VFRNTTFQADDAISTTPLRRCSLEFRYSRLSSIPLQYPSTHQSLRLSHFYRQPLYGLVVVSTVPPRCSIFRELTSIVSSGRAVSLYAFAYGASLLDSGINPATLTGAIDVIVVRRKDDVRQAGLPIASVQVTDSCMFSTGWQRGLQLFSVPCSFWKAPGVAGRREKGMISTSVTCIGS
jgi:hypothetical protein